MEIQGKDPAISQQDSELDRMLDEIGRKNPETYSDAELNALIRDLSGESPLDDDVIKLTSHDTEELMKEFGVDNPADLLTAMLKEMGETSEKKEIPTEPDRGSFVELGSPESPGSSRGSMQSMAEEDLEQWRIDNSENYKRNKSLINVALKNCCDDNNNNFNYGRTKNGNKLRNALHLAFTDSIPPDPKGDLTSTEKMALAEYVKSEIAKAPGTEEQKRGINAYLDQIMSEVKAKLAQEAIDRPTLAPEVGRPTLAPDVDLSTPEARQAELDRLYASMADSQVVESFDPLGEGVPEDLKQSYRDVVSLSEEEREKEEKRQKKSTTSTQTSSSGPIVPPERAPTTEELMAKLVKPKNPPPSDPRVLEEFARAQTVMPDSSLSPEELRQAKERARIQEEEKAKIAASHEMHARRLEAERGREDISPHVRLPKFEKKSPGNVDVTGSAMSNLASRNNTIILVDPANPKTMFNSGGVSGLIKTAIYRWNKKEKDVEKQTPEFQQYKKDVEAFSQTPEGLRCPNGTVKHTKTNDFDILHTSAPDLRKGKIGKRKSTEEDKKKLFESYFKVFEQAHLINQKTRESKELVCPLLGAGIFKWDKKVSAEIAGMAQKAFHDAYPQSNLQVSFVAKLGKRERIKDRVRHIRGDSTTRTLLDASVSKGYQSEATYQKPDINTLRGHIDGLKSELTDLLAENKKNGTLPEQKKVLVKHISSELYSYKNHYDEGIRKLADQALIESSPQMAKQQKPEYEIGAMESYAPQQLANLGASSSARPEPPRQPQAPQASTTSQSRPPSVVFREQTSSRVTPQSEQPPEKNLYEKLIDKYLEPSTTDIEKTKLVEDLIKEAEFIILTADVDAVPAKKEWKKMMSAIESKGDTFAGLIDRINNLPGAEKVKTEQKKQKM
ncbi:MAG: macro domain-containing protein [Proteobacteria bacterium]|nr:macro domain-containing protein [Pseudomonadota bacterium]